MKSLLQVIHNDSVLVGYVNILYTTYIVAQGVILTPVLVRPLRDAHSEGAHFAFLRECCGRLSPDLTSQPLRPRQCLPQGRTGCEPLRSRISSRKCLLLLQESSSIRFCPYCANLEAEQRLHWQPAATAPT